MPVCPKGIFGQLPQEGFQPIGPKILSLRRCGFCSRHRSAAKETVSYNKEHDQPAES